jgi:hypothetical protein
LKFKDVRVVRLGLDVQVAPRAVRLLTARRVEEGQEKRVRVAAVEDVRGQPLRDAVMLEREGAGPVRGSKLPVRGRDLEG